MSFTTKPTAVPEWATGDVVDGVTGQNNVIEPPAAKKLNGWAWKEKPARNWWNWLQRFNYLWINYFNQYHNGDAVKIGNQAEFNLLLTRVAANQYKISDSTLSLEVYPLSGGYQVSGALSGGDTWGYIETNNCVSIEFKGGAIIDFENERGYIEVNTDDCYLRNVDIRGTGTVASAIVQSYLLNANRVVFDNCKCSNRLSSTSMTGFQGSSTAAHNLMSRYNCCSIFSLSVTGGNLFGFQDCKNVQSPIIFDLESNGNVFGFTSCRNIGNFILNKIDGFAVTGLSNCDIVIGGTIEDLDATTSSAKAMNQCKEVIGLDIMDIQGATTAVGMESCLQIAACQIVNIDGDTDVYGMDSCSNISGIRISTVDSASGLAVGLNDCLQLSSAYIQAITGSTAGDGMRGCTYGAAINPTEATNPSNDWIDSSDAAITNKVSTPDLFT